MQNQYQVVTDRIVAMLEAGTRPWCKPWEDGAPVTGALVRPLRVCGTPYTGINVINLWCASEARGFRSRHWMTFKAAKDMGASVKKGAKAELAFYVGRKTVTEERDGEDVERQVSFLRAYHVFNADEIENLPARYLAAEPVKPAEPAAPHPFAHVQEFCDNTGASVAHGGNRAFYSPSTDSIRMPLLAQFRQPSLYFATLLHELAHWTSTPARCDRQLGQRFGDEAYAAEELVAELASAFLCADLAIDSEPREDHASYLASWIRVLKNDNRAIFKAATLAESAARFLHARQPAAEPAPIAEPAPVADGPRKAAKGFRGAADFQAALTAARHQAARKYGQRWDLAAGAKVWARVPAAWARLPVFGRVSRGPRDIALPAAEFWPGGQLPAGIDLAPAAAAPMPYPAEPTPATLALWARAHGLVRLADSYVHPLEAGAYLAHQAQNAANRSAKAELEAA